MLKNKIKRILNEIKFSQDWSDELKDKYRWRYVQTSKPKSDSKYNSVRIYTFTTPKKNEKGVTAGFKYIVKIEEYDYDFFLISFSTKLNKDFYVKQQRLSSSGEKYHDEYSYLTKEKIPLQILSLMVSEMKNILNEKPYASFGYFGAPDYKKGEDTDIFNTKRVRVYNQLLNDEFNQTHVVKSELEFSGGLVLNKEVLGEYPNLEMYCRDILQSHL
jgi:hypothetical protein